tara:strand:+ start:179 stop:487 length:309 start_codon:yes stop_codon:yes gene_type:complete
MEISKEVLFYVVATPVCLVIAYVMAFPNRIAYKTAKYRLIEHEDNLTNEITYLIQVKHFFKPQWHDGLKKQSEFTDKDEALKVFEFYEQRKRFSSTKTIKEV